MLAAPFGSWLTKMDALMVGAMDTATTGLCGKAVAPMTALMVLWFCQRAIAVAKGDPDALVGIIPKLVQFGVALYVAGTASVYNQWVRDFFFLSVPSYLIAGVTDGLAGTMVATVVGGVNGVAAAFDVCWAQMWQQASATESLAGTFDVGTKAAVLLSVLIGGAAQGTMAMVYLATRFVLSLVLDLGVPVFMLYPADACKPMLPRWFGKVMSLVFMQVVLVLVLVSVLTLDDELMQQILHASPTPGSTGLVAAAEAVAPGAPEALQGLTSMVMVFLMGAFAILVSPAIAYSIGGGIAISTLPILAAAYSAVAGAASGGAAALEMIPAYPELGANGGGGLSMGLAEAPLAGGGGSALPPPSPPSLASSGPRMLR